MAWARLDDGFHDHPKVDDCSLAAIGLYTLCLTWAHRHRKTALVPGHIPDSRVRKVAGNKGAALSTELVLARLWEVEDGLGGYVIHDFAEYLPKERDPSERKEAGRKGAAKRWETDSKLPSTMVASDSSRASVPAFPTRQNNLPVVLPDPTRSGSNEPAHEANAGNLIKEHLDAMKVRPPDRVVGQTAKIVGELLGEGIDERHIRGGLALLRQKAMHPSVLPSLVNEAMNPPQRIAKTDLAVLDGMSVAAELQARGM